MPNEPALSATATATTPPVGEPAASAAERAQEMRTRLGARREAEEIVAEASRLRRAAAEDADTTVAEAEALATQLVIEAREAAEQLAAEAKERADAILARAYDEAEDLQRHTEEERARIREEVVAVGRAEIEEFRARSVDALGSAEDRLTRLAPSLEDAVTTVTEVLRSLEELRNGPAEVEVAASPSAIEPRPADPDADTDTDTDTDTDVSDGSAEIEDMVAERAPTTTDDAEARPLGWLFRASQT